MDSDVSSDAESGDEGVGTQWTRQEVKKKNVRFELKVHGTRGNANQARARGQWPMCACTG